MQLKTSNKLSFRRYIFWITAIFTFHFCSVINAQESCTQTLVDAQDVFSSGQIELVPGILEPCIDRGFTRQEKIAAYRLLTLCHLYYNHTAEAAVTMEKMLKINPEYKIQDIDPSEFINLHSTFRTNPLFILGAKGGLGGFNFYETTNYNDINSTGYEGNYTPNISLMGGLSIEVPIIAELSVVLETFYNTYSYTFNKTSLNYATTNFVETIKGIEVPFMVQWNILKNKKATPYINVGASMYYLLSSTADITRKDTLTGGQSRETPALKPDLTDSRNSLNFGIVGGAGVRIKDIIGKGYLTFDVRYSRYFKNNVEKEDRANNSSLTYSYMYTDNSIKIQNFQFLIGYKIPIYFAKQRKSARADH